jgi:hypothetical protein
VLWQGTAGQGKTEQEQMRLDVKAGGHKSSLQTNIANSMAGLPGGLNQRQGQHQGLHRCATCMHTQQQARADSLEQVDRGRRVLAPLESVIVLCRGLGSTTELSNSKSTTKSTWKIRQVKSSSAEEARGSWCQQSCWPKKAGTAKPTVSGTTGFAPAPNHLSRCTGSCG